MIDEYVYCDAQHPPGVQVCRSGPGVGVAVNVFVDHRNQRVLLGRFHGPRDLPHVILAAVEGMLGFIPQGGIHIFDKTGGRSPVTIIPGEQVGMEKVF